MQTNQSTTVLLDSEEAARYLRLARPTLEAWRTRGGGPAFIKLGKAVRYRQTDLDEYLNSRTFANTSEFPGK